MDEQVASVRSVCPGVSDLGVTSKRPLNYAGYTQQTDARGRLD